MADRRYGVALVGAGNIAPAHIDAVAADERARLLGITAADAAQARALAARHGVRHYPDVAAIAADPDVDLVAICTPSGAHLEPATAVIRAGKHVVVEKPLEVSSERARALVKEADAAGVTLSTVFNSRFGDANAFVRRAVTEGRLGRMVQGDAYVKWFRDQAYYDSADWRGTFRLDGGGALMNQAIHHLDLLLWIMGPVREVFAYADTLTHQGLEVEDTLVAVMRYRNGALGTFTAATSLFPGRPKALDLHGSRGAISVRDEAIVSCELADLTDEERAAMPGTTAGSTSGTFADPMAMSFENHRRQLEDFLRAIDEGTAPLVDGREGLRSVALVEAIYRSVREGRPVAP